MVSFDVTTLAGLGVAILGGAAVGVERQRSGHATGPDARLGGIRTFTLLGTVAGIAGQLIAFNNEFATIPTAIARLAIAFSIGGGRFMRQSATPLIAMAAAGVAALYLL